MESEQKKILKTIIWGTIIVTMVPSGFILLRQWILGELSGSAFQNLTEYLQTTLFSGVVTFSIFTANTYVIGFLDQQLEGKMSNTKRFIRCLLWSLLLSNLIIYLEWLIFDHFWFHVPADERRTHIFENQVLATVLVIMVNLVFEIRHYIEALKVTIAEKERLEKENMRAQLESLKTQMSPHFLFNSFNALQSLIDIDAGKAKEFLQELSKVYRYVLENQERLVVELSQELNFIRSYIYLNQIRFGSNLMFTCEITDNAMKTFVPPLTLQILVENAIKHNIISTQMPLHINIRSNDQHLVISNNFQLRNEMIVSTGIGIRNLEERYYLICQQKPVVSIIDQHFIVTIPFIEKEN